jgi:hypothetical protein
LFVDVYWVDEVTLFSRLLGGFVPFHGSAIGTQGFVLTGQMESMKFYYAGSLGNTIFPI